MSDKKIVSREFFAGIRDDFRRTGKKIVLCHGVFDLLHYGHIVHLQEAKKQGDILVVSVTSERFVRKGPGRPYFNDQQRLFFLSSLSCIDYVILSESLTAHEIVESVQPDIYAKGQEYACAENDVTGNIGAEEALVKQYGGRIYFTEGEVYSSTKLLNNFFGALPKKSVEQSRKLHRIYGDHVAQKLRQMIESFTGLKVLVIGDVILDDYVFCKMLGLTTKDEAISTRYDSHERYAGGSLAIARHIANFADDVTLLSMMGHGENDIEQYLLRTMPPVNCRMVKAPHFVTPIKKRYLKRHPLRQEYEKLFSVNRLLSPEEMKSIDYGEFYRLLEQMLPAYDLVVVCDYGHGLLNPTAIRLIEEKAHYLVVNCQANSSNYGTNVITKYHRADAFVVDERELHLPFGQSGTAPEELLKRLSAQLGSTYSWLTMGARGAIGCHGDAMAQIPAMTLQVKDTVGAGDAFYALATLCAAMNMPIDLATLVGNVAGAIKTGLLGNSRPIEKTHFLKVLNTVLNV